MFDGCWDVKFMEDEAWREAARSRKGVKRPAASMMKRPAAEPAKRCGVRPHSRKVFFKPPADPMAGAPRRGAVVGPQTFDRYGATWPFGLAGLVIRLGSD